MTGDPSTGEWERALADADVVVVGPVAPLRGGIAQHTARLGEVVRASGRRVAGLSWRRLYPSVFFPGRSQRTGAASPAWSREVLDVLSPASWQRAASRLATARGVVVVQWWHPVTAPACAVATRLVPRERLVALCHNAVPHEPLPGAAAAARLVLSRCGRVVCHSRSEAAVVGGLVGRRTTVQSVPLPCLLGEADLAARVEVPELAALPAGSRIVVAAGHVRPYKGTALLLRAWRRAKRPPSARLVVVGESYLAAADRRTVAELAAGDRSILFENRYVEDVELVRVLRSSELLVAAHLRASQSGLVPLARALGLACLVSDAGGLSEQAAPCGRSQVVRAGDEDALRDAIEQRLAGPVVRLHEEGSAAERMEAWRRVLEAITGASR